MIGVTWQTGVTRHHAFRETLLPLEPAVAGGLGHLFTSQSSSQRLPEDSVPGSTCITPVWSHPAALWHRVASQGVVD